MRISGYFVRMQTRRVLGALAAAGLFVVLAVEAFAQSGNGSWLDQPLARWNQPGASVPAAPQSGESAAALRARCAIPAPATAAHRAVEAAGWVAYDHLDRPLRAPAVTVVAGMTAADAACAPSSYQLFVFLSDGFAGTVSPVVMTAARDGSAGTARLFGDALLTVEFARYAASDASCCPSSRIEVRYALELSRGGPALDAVNVRTTRGN